MKKGEIELPRVVRHYERTDFSSLLEDLKTGDNKDDIARLLENPPKFEKEVEETVVISDAERLHRKRSSMLDDRKYKYIIDKRNGIIHDRDCEYQKQIPDSDFDMLEDINTDSNVCISCREAAYIRHALGDDGKRIGQYLNFFRRTNTSYKTIYKLTIQNQAKLYMEDLNTLQIQVREDTWKIRLHTKGNVTLYHNNYILLEDGSRYFVDGYHKQIIGKRNTYHNALSVIYNYSWEKHLQGQEAKRMKKLSAETLQQPASATINNSRGNFIIRKIFRYVAKLFDKK